MIARLDAPRSRRALRAARTPRHTATMTEARIRASIEAFISAWNEVDVLRRHQLLERACAHDIVFRTTGRRVEGRAELEALMADFRRRCPADRAELTSAVDVQGSLFRYAGVVVGPDGPRGENYDAGECDDEGRIRLVLTFPGAALPARA